MVILQHPLEVLNAKGSARLLHLSVTGSKMVTGETFNPAALRELLYGGNRRPILLYPETPDERSLGMEPPPVLEREWLDNPGTLRLVMLDGTWRKSRKMLYLNRLLHDLPRLVLTDMPATRYVIRKAHAPDQLSTLEAACYTLMELEGNVQKYLPVLAAFDAFVKHARAAPPS